MNNALPSESYIARLDYLAFNGKVCNSVAYSDEQRFLEDLKESLYHGEPLCVVLYRDRNGKTISEKTRKSPTAICLKLKTIRKKLRKSE